MERAGARFPSLFAKTVSHQRRAASQGRFLFSDSKAGSKAKVCKMPGVGGKAGEVHFTYCCSQGLDNH